ncbi:hypothetical protein Tco_0650620 [Tanacetum coccineum]
MLAIEGNFNPGNNRNRAQGRAFGLGVAEAAQDPNVVTGTFSINDHFATVLFDSGADSEKLSKNSYKFLWYAQQIAIGSDSFDISNGPYISPLVEKD